MQSEILQRPATHSGAVAGLRRLCETIDPTMGAGRCSISGCPCPSYENTIPQSELCNNCGHQYRDHW